MANLRILLRRIGPLVCLFLFVFPAVQPVQAASREELLRRREAIADYAEQVRRTWKIPGLSVSVVWRDSLEFAGGSGVREAGSRLPADGRTLYHIGSVSKSFTAVMLASLADEGLLSWNDTVKRLMPDFRWADPYVEESMLVKELLLHRTGWRGQAGTYLPNLGYGREDICRMMARVEPVHPFREVYAYNNLTFLWAARLVETLTGKTWEENLQERVLDPLGMSHTVTGETGYLAAGERAAVQHEFSYDSRDTVRVRPLYGEDRALHWLTVIGPAGGICSDVTDMARYVKFHLHDGVADGRRVVSERQMRYLHRGQTIVSQDSSYIRLYGLCWFVEQNAGYRILFHTGTTWGHTALCAFVPELDLGLMISCNAEVSEGARYALMRRIVDLYRGAPFRDWNSELFGEWLARNRRAGSARPAEECIPVREWPAESLTGRYVKDELFGDAEILQQDGRLRIRIGKAGWTHDLEFSPQEGYGFWSDGHWFPVTFTPDADGEKAAALTVDFNYDEGFGPWVREP